jgi:hypothetical protein
VCGIKSGARDKTITSNNDDKTIQYFLFLLLHQPRGGIHLTAGEIRSRSHLFMPRSLMRRAARILYIPALKLCVCDCEIYKTQINNVDG